MSNRSIVVLFFTIPLATLISYLMHKFYNKNIQPSIIGLAIASIYIIADSLLNKKDEKS